MMRSFSARRDTVVCDEPLYAHYLAATGLDHPGRDEVIAHHDADWRSVVAWLTGSVPEGKAVFYQKHMAHHLRPEIDRAWLDALTHAFLIRDPRHMLTSLDKRIDDITIESTGLPRQVELFERVADRLGAAPPVLDARDVLRDPRAALGALCARLHLPFLESMLSWPAGRRSTDGIWARHWYDAVEASTGFAPYREKDEAVPEPLRPVCDACLPLYDRLAAHRLAPTD
jgi:hypothetical protein